MPHPRVTAVAVACLVASGMLLVAAFTKMPIGYYTAMRWVASGSALAVGITLSRGNRHIAALPAWGIVILLCPISNIHLDRETWRVIDVIAGVVVAVLGFMAIRTKADTSKDVGIAAGTPLIIVAIALIALGSRHQDGQTPDGEPAPRPWY